MAAAARWKKAGNLAKAQVAAVEGFKSVPHGIDGATFFSPVRHPRSFTPPPSIFLLTRTLPRKAIPEEIKSAVPLMYSFDAPAISTILEGITASFRSGSLLSDGDFGRLQAAIGKDASVRGGTPHLHTPRRSGRRRRAHQATAQRWWAG